MSVVSCGTCWTKIFDGQGGWQSPYARSWERFCSPGCVAAYDAKGCSVCRTLTPSVYEGRCPTPQLHVPMRSGFEQREQAQPRLMCRGCKKSFVQARMHGSVEVGWLCTHECHDAARAGPEGPLRGSTCEGACARAQEEALRGQRDAVRRGDVIEREVSHAHVTYGWHWDGREMKKEDVMTGRKTCLRCEKDLIQDQHLRSFCTTGCRDAYTSRMDAYTSRMSKPEKPFVGKPFTANGGTIQPFEEVRGRRTIEPNRSPSPQQASGDLAYVVFTTDPRVLGRAREKYEVKPGTDAATCDAEAKHLRESVRKLWDLGEKGHAPEAGWLSEARTLGERVGKPWYEAPQPTLVEALGRHLTEELTPLGFEIKIIPPGAEGVLQADPQVAIRGRRLVLGTDEVARSLLVVDLKVGHDSCLASSAPIPGALFGPSAFPVLLQMRVAQIGHHVRLHVTNTSGATLTVSAVLLGREIKDPPRGHEMLRLMDWNAGFGEVAVAAVACSSCGSHQSEVHEVGCPDRDR